LLPPSHSLKKKGPVKTGPSKIIRSVINLPAVRQVRPEPWMEHR